jgi:threonine dehydrogenase-like Zn-dependent dehydrogenase
MAEVDEGGTFVVIGAGPVGLMAVLAARERGARRLYAIDTIAARLARAEALGAIPIDAGGTDPRATVRGATDGRGADAVMEAVGSAEAGRLAFDLVRPGGIVATVGVHHDQGFPFSPAAAYDRNLTWKIGRCPARSLMPELVPLARARRRDLAALLTHRLPLARGAEGYRLFEARADGCLKVAFEM